jgi:hypothetical protein
MNTSTRTDAHRPSQFIAGEYEEIDCFDLDFGTNDEEYRRWQMDRLRELGERHVGVHGLHRCDVCGTHLRYMVVWEWVKGGVIYSGEECASTIASAAATARVTGKIARLRKAAAEWGKKARAWEAFCAEYEDANEVAAFVTARGETRGGDFWISVSSRLHRDGSLSDRTVAAVRRSMSPAMLVAEAIADAARLQRKADRGEAVATSQYVGTEGKRQSFGRCTVIGRREIDGNYGLTTLLRLSDASGNILTWFASGSPASQVGDAVEVIATVKRHEERDGGKQTVITRAKLAPLETTA